MNTAPQHGALYRINVIETDDDGDTTHGPLSGNKIAYRGATIQIGSDALRNGAIHIVALSLLPSEACGRIFGSSGVSLTKLFYLPALHSECVMVKTALDATLCKDAVLCVPISCRLFPR